MEMVWAGLGWAAELRRMYYAFRLDGKAIPPVITIKLSITACIFIEILRRKTTFAETIESLLSYKRASTEDYGVDFIKKHKHLHERYIVLKSQACKVQSDPHKLL